MKKTILVLTADPSEGSTLKLDRELREIRSGLERAKHRDRFHLVQRWAVRPQDVQRAMLDEEPNIVHFAGHGVGEEGLIFEDRAGKAKFVRGETLARLFALFADSLECVVLNGCYSKVQAEAISEHIPYVIGMTSAITNAAGIAFAVGFYDALGAGRDVSFAFDFACAVMDFEDRSAVPVFLKRSISPSQTLVQPGNEGLQKKGLDISSTRSGGSGIRIYISADPSDEAYRDNLEKHLTPLRRQGLIQTWHRGKMLIGSVQDDEAKQELEKAHIILLMVSPDYIFSEPCHKERQRAMERHEAGQARVIPILLRPAGKTNEDFEKLRGLPSDGHPVSRWGSRDQAFVDVVQGIRRVVENL